MSKKVTAPAVMARKVRSGSDPLVMVTAYDAPGARIADEAGVDLILVGDSLAMVVLGYDDTLQVTIDDMAHHTAAVARATPSPLIVGDLPWMSYHVSVDDTVRNAATLIRAGAQAVKLEGGRKRVPMIEAIVDAEIPVMGHIGLTPQSVHAMGGFKVQGREHEAALALVADAKALAARRLLRHRARGRARRGGAPGDRGRRRADDRHRRRAGIATARCSCSTTCSGIEDRIAPKFVRRYATLKSDAVAAMGTFADDVRVGRFPSDAESYHLSDEVAEALGLYGAVEKSA